MRRDLVLNSADDRDWLDRVLLLVEAVAAWLARLIEALLWFAVDGLHHAFGSRPLAQRWMRLLGLAWVVWTLYSFVHLAAYMAGVAL